MARFKNEFMTQYLLQTRYDLIKMLFENGVITKERYLGLVKYYEDRKTIETFTVWKN